MSEHEFEQYLRILGGVLRLNAKQRGAIANELRDHLETRLDELLAEGVSREKAILIALEEFGDVAGLAADFTHIFRQQRRKNVMKFTTYSVSTLAVATILVLAMWPENARVRFTGNSIAQVEGQLQPAAEAVSSDAPITPSADRADEESIRQNNAETERKLARRIDASFQDVPMSDVIAFVNDSLETQCYIDEASLSEDGISFDATVKINLRQVRGDMLLELALAQVDNQLGYFIRDGIIVISSSTHLEGITEVQVYDCRDLFSMPSLDVESVPVVPIQPANAVRTSDLGIPGAQPLTDRSVLAQFGLGGGGGGAVGGGDGGGGLGCGTGLGYTPTAHEKRATRLMHLITSSIHSEWWEENGGYGTINEFNGFLVINHNPRIQQKVAKLLEKLRMAAKAATKAGGTNVPAATY